MFDAAWKALLCFATLAVANTVTLLPAFFRVAGSCQLLTTTGWTLLLVGSLTPLVAIFYSAARANRTDEGIWIGVALGIVFLFRCSWELGRISHVVLASVRKNGDAT